MQHDDSSLIDHLGGNKALAEEFDISSQAISKWRKTGIPPICMKYLRLKFADKLAALAGSISTVNPENTPNPESPISSPIECGSVDPRHGERRQPDKRSSHDRRENEAT